MRYMDVHRTEQSEEDRDAEEFFQSVPVAEYGPGAVQALPGLEGLFFIVLTTAALIAGMLLISLVTSRDLSLTGGASGFSLQTAPALSTPSSLQGPVEGGDLQVTDVGATLQSTGASDQTTGGVQGIGVSAQVLQGAGAGASHF